MTASDLPCDVEAASSDKLTEGVAVRQALHAIQRYGALPGDRDSYATLLLIYAIRLASHRMGVGTVSGICLRALERERGL